MAHKPQSMQAKKPVALPTPQHNTRGGLEAKASDTRPSQACRWEASVARTTNLEAKAPRRVSSMPKTTADTQCIGETRQEPQWPGLQRKQEPVSQVCKQGKASRHTHTVNGTPKWAESWPIMTADTPRSRHQRSPKATVLGEACQTKLELAR